MLHDRPTLTGFIVTPVVAWIPPAYPFTPEPYEVAAVVDLPARHFTEAMRVRPMPLDHRRLCICTKCRGTSSGARRRGSASDLGAALALCSVAHASAGAIEPEKHS